MWQQEESGSAIKKAWSNACAIKSVCAPRRGHVMYKVLFDGDALWKHHTTSVGWFYFLKKVSQRVSWSWHLIVLTLTGLSEMRQTLQTHHDACCLLINMKASCIIVFPWREQLYQRRTQQCWSSTWRFPFVSIGKFARYTNRLGFCGRLFCLPGLWCQSGKSQTDEGETIK